MSDKPNTDPPTEAHNADNLGGESPAYYASQTDLSNHAGSDNPHPRSAELVSEGGVLLSSQVPDLAITETYTVAGESERFALDPQEGDVAIQNDNDTTYMFTGGDPSVDSNWSIFIFDVPVTSVDGMVGDVVTSAVVPDKESVRWKSNTFSSDGSTYSYKPTNSGWQDLGYSATFDVSEEPYLHVTGTFSSDYEMRFRCLVVETGGVPFATGNTTSVTTDGAADVIGLDSVTVKTQTEATSGIGGRTGTQESIEWRHPARY